MATSANGALNRAKRDKKDEWYTRLCDISDEVHRYPAASFENKVVYCNCDNPAWSNFWRFFHENFKALKLKRLLGSFYSESEDAYLAEYDGTGDDANVLDITKRTPVSGLGSFVAPECKSALYTADIVVTNPPFSLFGTFFGVVMQWYEDRHRNNEFAEWLIVCNQNVMTQIAPFPYFKSGVLKIGGPHDGFFYSPYAEPGENKEFDMENREMGILRFSGAIWLTTLEQPEVRKPMKLLCSVEKNPEKYARYDNYDALNVDATWEIPSDYDGVMGVPVSFINYYSPLQFEIIGHTAPGDYDLDCIHVDGTPRGRGLIGDRVCYDRIMIKRRLDWTPSSDDIVVPSAVGAEDDGDLSPEEQLEVKSKKRRKMPSPSMGDSAEAESVAPAKKAVVVKKPLFSTGFDNF